MKRICSGSVLLALFLASSACSAEPAVEPAGGSVDVARLGSMSVARAVHQTTLLPSGKVLVTGGCSGRCDVTLDAVEAFDPATGRTETLAPMAVARNSHAAMALEDGRVLVMGGWHGREVTASAEIFDPATSRFERIASMTIERAVPAIARLADGRILVTGGQTAGMVPLDSVELFDPVTERFTPSARMGSPRFAHVAVTLADGRVLVAGGIPARRGEVLRSAEIFDPATGEFLPTGDMAMPRCKFAAVRLMDGRVLMIGGAGNGSRDARYRSTELFDPETGRFSRGPDMRARRYKLPDGAVLLPSGDVLVAAGDAQVERYNASTETFEVLSGEMAGAHEFATATLLDGGDVLVLGGYGEQIDTTASAWRVRLRAGD